MTISWLIQADLPPFANVSELTRELEAYTSRLLAFERLGPDPKLIVILLGPEHVVVNADALIRLQEKAGLKD